jgi:hypothetical protein
MTPQGPRTGHGLLWIEVGRAKMWKRATPPLLKGLDVIPADKKARVHRGAWRRGGWPLESQDQVRVPAKNLIPSFLWSQSVLSVVV